MKKSAILILAPFIFSCDNDDNGGGGSGTPAPTAEFFIQATVDEDEILYQNISGGDFAMSYGNGGSIGTEFCSFSYESGISNVVLDYRPDMSVNFDNWVATVGQGNCSDDDLFDESFVTGPVIYTNGTTKGVEIIYLPADDLYFTSSAGSQSGSTFEITSRELVPATAFTQALINLKGTFSCKLYEDGNPSNMRSVENGNFSLQFLESDY